MASQQRNHVLVGVLTAPCREQQLPIIKRRTLESFSEAGDAFIGGESVIRASGLCGLRRRLSTGYPRRNSWPRNSASFGTTFRQPERRDGQSPVLQGPGGPERIAARNKNPFEEQRRPFPSVRASEVQRQALGEHFRLRRRSRSPTNEHWRRLPAGKRNRSGDPT